MTPRETLELFDLALQKAGLRLDAVIVGGAALNLLGTVARPTKDCDVVSPLLAAPILAAARAFAAARRAAGEELDDDWLNNGPTGLRDVLPSDWAKRVVPVFTGRAIALHTLGRSDLLKTKLFALCDRGLDIGDCVAMAPSVEELQEAAPWLELQDGNEHWPAHVREVLDDLAKRLGHVA